jgi:hypothetical protein
MAIDELKLRGRPRITHNGDFGAENAPQTRHYARSSTRGYPFLRRGLINLVPASEKPVARQKSCRAWSSVAANNSSAPHPAALAVCAAALTSIRPMPLRRLSGATTNRVICATGRSASRIRYQCSKTRPIGGPHSAAINAPPGSWRMASSRSPSACAEVSVPTTRSKSRKPGASALVAARISSP